MEALDQVGLAELALQRADRLSGGQSQRVAIARALVAAPRFIFADEPAASLDPAAGDEVMQTFVKVGRETNTTLVFSTHNLDHALTHAGRILGLHAGRLVLDAPTSHLEAGALRGLYH
jgi:phosphonate transport system ATP-binding protein